ncbi:MAG: UDP-N-acetylmuramoyl-tripeptide--D-alanyl-D-alanine ligase [Clostridia bacterium]|nr:UDP-N-acetylmuramoyl-tripeptide--D-alanyl-D-alanine ligase [Clostridia bacterium]
MRVTLGRENIILSEIARACGGILVGKDRTLHAVCTDSREADKETMFVALRGERTDGHRYISGAVERGCCAVLCESWLPLGDASAVIVKNTEHALCRLAEFYLDQQRIPCVAVTGSVGKTTTKEFVAAVLSSELSVYKTVGNYNSTVGMPLSALEITPAHRAAVFEMGMSGQGEIARMSRAAKPDIAVITNIGSSHLEYLETRENIAKAKLEITQGLRDGGLLLLNGDEPLLRGVGSSSYRVQTVTLDGDGDYRGCNIVLHPGEECTTFDLYTPDGILKDFRIPAVGKHMVYDAIFAYVVGKEMGLDENSIRQWLLTYRSGGLRQRLLPMGDITVLEDCYNAAPESMRAALYVLGSFARERHCRSIAVLGDMRELGMETRYLHEQIGVYAVEQGISVLMTLGELGASIAEGAMGAGLNDDCVLMHRDLSDLDSAAELLLSRLESGDMVLVKASRGVAAERLIEALRRHLQQE